MSESGDMNTLLRNFEVNDDDQHTKISKMIHIPTLRLHVTCSTKTQKTNMNDVTSQWDFCPLLDSNEAQAIILDAALYLYM